MVVQLKRNFHCFKKDFYGGFIPDSSATGEGVFPWEQALRVPQIAIARYDNRYPIFHRSAPSPCGVGLGWG